MTDKTAVKLKILGKDIQVGCKPGEQEALLNAARYVEAEMKNLQSRGSNPSTEKIAIITAMNMANELLTLRAGTGQLDSATSIIEQMQNKLKNAIG